MHSSIYTLLLKGGGVALQESQDDMVNAMRGEVATAERRLEEERSSHADARRRCRYIKLPRLSKNHLPVHLPDMSQSFSWALRQEAHRNPSQSIRTCCMSSHGNVRSLLVQVCGQGG